MLRAFVIKRVWNSSQTPSVGFTVSINFIRLIWAQNIVSQVLLPDFKVSKYPLICELVPAVSLLQLFGPASCVEILLKFHFAANFRTTRRGVADWCLAAPADRSTVWCEVFIQTGSRALIPIVGTCFFVSFEVCYKKKFKLCGRLAMKIFLRAVNFDVI